LKSSVWAKNHPESWKNNLNRKSYLRDRQAAFKKYWKTHDPYKDNKTKICAKCGIEQSSRGFFKNSCDKDGLQAYCITCLHERHVSNPARQMLVNAKARATKRGIEFSINESDIVIPLLCPVLGIPLNAGQGQRQSGSPTLDRWDNFKGYTPDNICVISYRANTLKSDATVEEMEKVTEYMRHR
jgi:hypothetical protein